MERVNIAPAFGYLRKPAGASTCDIDHFWQLDKLIRMRRVFLSVAVGLFGLSAFVWKGLATEKEPQRTPGVVFDNIDACVKMYPDVVIVCEYAEEYKTGSNPFLWDLATSCTVVESEKGVLNKGQKIVVHRTLEKTREDDPVPKPDLGELRYLFYDSAAGYIDTAAECKFDQEIENRVKADVAKERKASSEHR